MKKLVTFIILILSILLFSNNLFLFKNIGLISKDYVWTNELKIPLRADENVIFVENAEYYKIEFENLENVNFKFIGTNDDLRNILSSRVNIINLNPLILKDALTPNFIYYYDNYLKVWWRTDLINLNTLMNNKILYAKNIKGMVIISKPLKWDFFYDLKSNGDLFITYKINGKIDEPYNVTLIDEAFNISNNNQSKDIYTKTLALEAAPYAPIIVNESAIINFGEILPFDGEFSKVIKLGTIKNYEDINYLNFSFYSNSFENKYLEIIREFENTKNNGLGIPLIKGKIHIFTKKDNKEFIQKVSTISKTNENETTEIFLGQSWNSTADLQIVNELRTKDYIDRTFKITIKSSGKAKIVINGGAMKLLSVKGNYLKKIENSDKITFYTNDNQTLELTIRNYK
ncbi:hypothetical protein JCM30566_09430 [Marinitoga arctica]